VATIHKIMKYSIAMILLVSYLSCFAQSEISRQFKHQANQPLSLQFDDASVISVSGWNENYVSIQATVTINGDLQNDNYQIEEVNENGWHKITGFIRNKSSIPQVIRIKKGDEVFFFQTDDWNSPQIQNFYATNGRDGIQWTSQGISWDIKITIKIPSDADLKIESKHGIIELTDLTSNVEATSTHGGIDLSVSSGETAKIDAKTRWGTIYSDLNLKIDKTLSSDDDWNHVIGNVNGGSGHTLTLASKHANIYLRNRQVP